MDFLYPTSNIYGYTLSAIDYFEEKFGAFSTEAEQVKILKMIDEMERAAKKSTTILKLIDSEDAIFEVFTDSENENTAMVELCNIKRDQGAVIKSEIVGLAKDVLKPEGIMKIKRILGN